MAVFLVDSVVALRFYNGLNWQRMLGFIVAEPHCLAVVGHEVSFLLAALLHVLDALL